MENSSENSMIASSKKTIKKASCVAVFVVTLVVGIGTICSILWAGGWMKKATCDIVLEDSFVWEKANCSKKINEEKTEVNQGETIKIEVPKDIETEEELITSIIDQASPAVVTITISNLSFDEELGMIDQNEGIGSGFVIDSKGTIITNQHVVSDESASYSVLFPGEEEPTPVTNIYRDRTNDIAIVKVDRNDLKALSFGDSDELKRGNLVIAIGSPYGDLTGTATIGYVTGLNRDVTAGDNYFGDLTKYEDVIQTDAAINPGNSGGPLLNSKGEVIGINFATTSGADNISFAIPVNQLKSRLAVYEKEGRFPQPFIGVSYSQRTFLYKNQVIVGAIVYEVEKDSPAYTAGLKRGDIILSANGESMEEISLSAVIQSLEVGEELNLKVLRKDESIDIKVVVGDKGE